MNGRFLEIRVHLPREWAELEPELRTLAQSMMTRGTVDLHVSRGRGTENTAHVEIDERLAREWVQALKKLAEATGFKQGHKPGQDMFPFEVLAKAPDVIRVVNDNRLSESEKDDVLKTATEALKALDKEKLREGRAIQDELLRLMDELTKAVKQVAQLASQAPDDLRARLKSRMDRLEASGLKPPGSEDARFHQEVAILIDRGDVQEEIARLSAHLTVYRDLVKSPSLRPNQTLAKSPAKNLAGASVAPIGKTLDFYAQELLREVNTVGSKSQTAELTRLVVEAKTLVEKIREQVQNVE